jgi:predicted regulator of Ras-like GTPase activity (Roadblock/LC7/MglB family)
LTSEVLKEAHTKDKVLDEALEDIVKTRKNAQGAVIVSHQGFIIASNMGKETFADPRMIGALCVEFVKTAQNISKKLFLNEESIQGIRMELGQFILEIFPLNRAHLVLMCEEETPGRLSKLYERFQEKYKIKKITNRLEELLGS